MTRLHASEFSGPAPDRQAAAPAALFLHTGWRSAGTWVWSRCREQAGVHAFSEPLHERLAWLRPADITALRPGAWASNHRETAPYFQEYGALLRPGLNGIPSYRRRFAFARFFLAPDEDDPELAAYLDTLLSATAPGRTATLKFCRSLGRVGWMERRFAHVLHIVLLRDPVSQFASAQALLAAQRNRYFSTAPLMVLASNAAHPLVRQATAALGVRPPELHSDDLAYVTETCWRHVRRSGPGERYRQFLAFWAATALHALHSDAQVLEPGRLGRDAAYRDDMEALLSRVAGPGVSLAPRDGVFRDTRATARASALPAAELDEAHLAASVLVRACGGALPAARVEMLLRLLTGERALTATRPIPGSQAVSVPSAMTEPWQKRARPSAGRRMATFALVLAARALQPVRRLHGRIVRWQHRRLPGRSADQIT